MMMFYVDNVDLESVIKIIFMKVDGSIWSISDHDLLIT